MSEQTSREDLIRKDCEIAGSNLCYWLDKSGCHDCYLAGKKKEERERAAANWEVTLSLLPKDVDALHERSECQFCKDEPRPADGYAMVEMAHPEPYYEKGMFFGIGKKVRTPVGSLVSLQMSVCPTCRKAFRMGDVWQLGVFLGMLALSLVLIMIPSIYLAMASVNVLIPIAFVVVMTVAGYLLGKNLSMAHWRKIKHKVKVNLAEIPEVEEMLGKGWFFFQINNGMPRVFFNKKKNYERLRKPVEPCEEDEVMLDNINI